jgi:hypothetical protein
MSVRLSIRVYHLGLRSTNFREIHIRDCYENLPKKIQILLKADKKYRANIIYSTNKVKVKFILEQAMKAQRVSRGIALLFL